MKLYEIINPSDKVLIQAESDTVAGVAVLLLASGKYGLVTADAEERTVLPVFFCGGSEEWLVEHEVIGSEASMDSDLGAWVAKHALELAAVYDSAFYGGASEFRALERALSMLPEESRGPMRALYNDEKRSSMNNIGAACQSYAKLCRDKAAKAGL